MQEVDSTLSVFDDDTVSQEVEKRLEEQAKIDEEFERLNRRNPTANNHLRLAKAPRNHKYLVRKTRNLESN